MKKTVFTNRSWRRFSPAIHSIALGCILILGTAIGFVACSKKNSQEQTLTSGKSKGTVLATQPLPRGKRFFSVTLGNFDTQTYTWARLMEWTLDSATGTITGKSWTWRNDVKTGKNTLNSHYCNLNGQQRTCNTYTPGGWGRSTDTGTSWTGTYIFNTTTNILDIYWTSPATVHDQWLVTLPETGLARVSLKSSNYTVTHGRGYGSKQPFSTFKTISNLVSGGLPTYTKTTSRTVLARSSTTNGAITFYPVGVQPGQWGETAMVLTNATTSTGNTNTLHRWDPPTGTSCGVPSACANGNPFEGTVYHWTTTNTSRRMAYSNWCACLPNPAGPTADYFPCYVGNMHTFAVNQIIDDNGVFKGFVGVEAQIPVESNYNGSWQIQVSDFTNIP